MTNLRPDISVTQVFQTATPNVPETSLPVLLIGVQRALNYRVNLGVASWDGDTSLAATALPSYQGGVVNDGSVDSLLTPKLFVTGALGTGEITSGVAFADLTTNPTVAITAPATAQFQLTTGTSGTFALASTPAESQFTDTSADFVVAQVSDGDVISSAGVDILEVVAQGLVSDDELTVRRLDKGPSTVAANQTDKLKLSAEDSDGYRVLTSTSTAFNTAGGFNNSGVAGGDYVQVDYWETQYSNLGPRFTAVGDAGSTDIAGVTPTNADRLLTIGDATTDHELEDGTISAYTGAWDNVAKTGLVFFLVNGEGQREPVFYGVSGRDDSGAEDLVLVRDYASNFIDDDLFEATGVEMTWAAMLPVAGGLVTTTGAFTVQTGTTRTFTDAGANFATVTSLIDASATGTFTNTDIERSDLIAVADSDGVYRPVFQIKEIVSDTELVVDQLGDVIDSGLAASNVDYVILRQINYTDASVASSIDSNVISSDERTQLTDEGSGVYRINRTGGAAIDYTTSVDPGDLIFTDKGALLGTAFFVDADDVYFEQHPLSSVTVADLLSDNFYFNVRHTEPVDFLVRRILSDSSLELQQLSTSTNSMPASTAVVGMVNFDVAPVVVVGVDAASSSVTSHGTYPNMITIADSVANLSYTITSTLSGGALSGDLSVTYAEDLNTNVTTPIGVTDSNRAAIVGEANPLNPLGLAASIALANTDTQIFILQAASDDVTGWTAAFNAAKVDTVYSIVPITEDDAIITLAQQHVDERSLPNNRQERILWQSKQFPDTVVRYSASAADGASVSKSVSGVQSVTVPVDLSALGVIVGDNFTGTTFDGTAEVTFTARITNVSVVGAVTTLTTLASSEIANGVTNLTLNSYSVTKAAQLDSEKATEVQTYLNGLSNRRIRNIFPYRYQVEFADNSGFFVDPAASNKTVTNYEVGGQYVAAAAAAIKATYGPTRPLTGADMAGFLRVIDPFLDNRTLQDQLIDNGAYYIEQIGGVGTAVQAIRALTTDITDFNFLEESVTTQVDSFARKLRAALRRIVGPYITDDRFFDVLGTVQSGVVREVLQAKELKRIKLLSAPKVSETDPDTFVTNYSVAPYFSGARGEITIFI